MVKKIAVGAGVGAALMAIVMGTVTPTLQDVEGTKYQAYKDIGGILTVCTGHTGPDVVVKKVYTPEECAALTTKDATTAAQGVLAVSPHLLYHPMQLAAMVSFSYNVGTGTYGKSSVAALANKGDFIGACNALLKYTYANGKYVPGLATRRTQEQTICLSTLTAEGVKNVGDSSINSK